MEESPQVSRRTFLWRGLTVPALLFLAACRGQSLNELFAELAESQGLAPTPACGDDDDEPTLAQTEGP